ncbi:hypothetical protein SLS64_004793 [Diaporthe eres]|uniref:Alcohol dehydrogenase n=1 Tax=Diaporthe eres TaxID=83184 RepID=A0ABR1P8V9_DIAER
MALSTFATSLYNASATMQAVLWEGTPYSMRVAEVPVPVIQNATDAIVRVTAAGICGTDLHVYRGTYLTTNQPPWIMGHEAIGVVAEVGDGVNWLRVGDQVIVPDRLDYGHLVMGSQRYQAFGTGTVAGSQAEYVRVPYADHSLVPIPTNGTSNATEPSLEYLMYADIFPTGWGGLDYAGFEPGDSVAIFGAGPVGMMSAYSAMLRGASAVYVVDSVPSRLELARSIGAVPISFNTSDPVDQILAYEPDGVARAVDAVGFEAVGADLMPSESIVLEQAIRVTRREGGLGILGLYISGSNSTGGPLSGLYPGNFTFPFGDYFGKALSMNVGPVNPFTHAPELVRLIHNGVANPGLVITTEIGIQDAPEAYARYERHEQGKTVIRFPWMSG